MTTAESDHESLHRPKQFAVLIDADNAGWAAQSSTFENLLAEVARFGEAAAKRIYGDFTSPNSAIWKKVLNTYAIKPVQQFAYTKGKNATDSALIIDAMDLLYTRRFDGFCIVSSDSDFTALALRVREEGLLVIGFGEDKTPEAFRNACHRFVFTEILRPAATGEARPAKGKSPASAAPAHGAGVKSKPRELPLPLIQQALDKAEDDDGWSNLGTFGSYLNQLQPEFDPRLFGYKKLSDLVRGTPQVFEIDERKLPNGTGKLLYVRPVASRAKK